WWVFNLRYAAANTGAARGFARNSLGPPSLATGARWISSVFQGLLGHGVGVFVALVLLAALWKVLVRKEKLLDGRRKVAISACICAVVPILLAQLTGTNHLLRHISPAMIPGSIGIGLLADGAAWFGSIGTAAASAALFCGQLIMLVGPVLFPNRQPVSLGL